MHVQTCKTIVFHRQVCKFETFLLPSSSWLLKLPNGAESGSLALRNSKTSLPDLVTLSALPPFYTQALNGVLEVSFVHRQCNFLIVNKHTHVSAADGSTHAMLLECHSYNLKTYGSRAFRVAAPELWNKLPREIKLCDDIDSFKKKLKTYLFNIAFN